jgi:hypothetical protein
MKKIKVFLVGIAVSLFLITQIQAQTLPAETVESTGSTSSTSFVDVQNATGAIDVTNVDNVLVVGTFTSKTTSGTSTGGYRIADVADNSDNSGEFQYSHAGKDGVGTLVHIFDVSGDTGNKSYEFQHYTDAQTLETSSTLTAIALNDGIYDLNSDVSQLAGVLVMSQTDSWLNVVQSSDVVLPANGGFYVAASLQNQRTSGGSSNVTSAEWVLQYKEASEADWKNISYPVERNPLMQQIGIVSLVGILPKSTSAGTYQFRVAYKKSGPHDFEVQECNLVVVALSNTGGSFPVFISSNPQAYTTSGTLSPVIENIITPKTNTAVFMQAQYAIQPNGTTESARHDIFVKKGGATEFDGMDFKKYLANSSHKCSGSASNLVDLVQDESYNVELRHASADGRNLATTNAYFVGFGLYRSSQSFTLPVTVTANQGISASAYSTLGGAINAINSGVFRGDITVRINDSTTETSTLEINASGTDNTFYNSILIYPTADGITVDGAEPLMILNGVENLTIDGRVNAEGNTPSLTFTSTGTTLRLQNSAANNLVRYTIIKGSSASTNSGVVHFYTSASGNGNSNNIFEYCHFSHAGTARPGTIIHSNGSSSRINRDNIIRYNDFYDFLSIERNSSAIRIASGSDFWTIEGNSFFETEALAPQSAFDYYIINLNIPSSNNFVVSDNYFGGSASGAQGDPFTFSTAVASQFKGIYLRTSDTDLSTLTGNTFSNFDFISTHPNPWDAIYSYSGKLYIADNLIGSNDAEGSIKIRTPKAYITAEVSGGAVTGLTIVGGGQNIPVAPVLSFSGGGGVNATATATVSGGEITGTTITNGGSGYTTAPDVRIENAYTFYSTVHGIRLFTQSDIEIVNNTIASFDLEGSSYYAMGFEGIYKDAGRGGNLLIQGNTIGKVDSPDNIIIRSTAEDAYDAQRMYGIYYQGYAIVQVIDNVISGLTNHYSGTSDRTATIGIYANRGQIQIEGNYVSHIKTYAGNGGGAFNASIFGIGIHYTSSGIIHTIKNNEVAYISNANTDSRVDLYGIYFAGANNIFHDISGNYVRDLSLSTADTGSYIDGVVIYIGKVNFFNNIVHLGQTNTGGHNLVGVWDHASWQSNINFYYNTIWIDGTASGATQSSYALWNRTQSGTPRIYKNNLFVNERSGGTGGKHYSARISTTQNLTIDYNTYYTDGSFLAQFGSSDRTSLADWKSSTSQDVNSYDANPAFAGSGDDYSKYYPTEPQSGVTGTGITTDYTGQLRSVTSPKLGALETYEVVWQGGTSTDFGTAANWVDGTVPGSGAVIKFADTPANDLYLDQDRVIGGIVNSSSEILNINGHTLTINGTAFLDEPGEITASSAGSSLVLQGSSAWQIPDAVFTGNTIENLVIDNSGGVEMLGDITIEEELKLLSGVFSIGDNELQINGDLTLSEGLLEGGDLSVLEIGGSGTSLNLPSITLKDFTLNRANGVDLIGDLTILGTMTLTDGTVSAGSNMLAFEGTSISGDGSVDVSDVEGLLLLQHTSLVSLPENFFANDVVSNLTINGDTLFAGNSFTVSGTLNLSGQNPAPDLGALDMGDTYVLTMGADAITLGAGDVTGRIRRTSIAANTYYTFGSEYATISFIDGTGAELPTEMLFIVKIGETHIVKENTLNRYYQIIRTGGTSPTRFILTLRYLDSELNGNNEEDLVFWDHHVPYNGTSPHEHGKSSQNMVLNTVTLASHGIAYLAQQEYAGEIVYVDDTTTPPNQSKVWLISEKESASDYEWLGAADDDWSNTSNWSGGMLPGAASDIIIRGNVPYNPVMTGSIEVNSLTILPGAQVNGSDAVLTVNSAININNGNVPWNNQGIFHPGTSKVIFTNANAAISGNTRFYNLEVADAAQVKLIEGTSVSISGALTLAGSGQLDVTSLGSSVVEYNGENQTIILPEGNSYHTLVLSGTGTKTLPASLTTIAGDFDISGAVTINVSGPLTIAGDLMIGEDAILNSGEYDHVLQGNMENNGTFTAGSSHSVSFTGSQQQVIGGDSKTTFNSLIIDNSNGVSVLSDIDVDGELTLTDGNLDLGAATLGINGTVSAVSNISTQLLSSLSFGGSTALTLPDDLFLPEEPVINDLTLNRSGGVVLNNQPLTISGDMTLTAGELGVAGKTLALGGNIIRTSGTLTTSATTHLLFDSNDEMLTLPDNMFSDPNLGKITINRFGGVGLGNQTINIHQKLILTEGLIYTDYSGIVSLTASASVGTTESNSTPGHAESYVSGITRKIGNTAFVFPIGNNGFYAPIGISDATGAGNNVDEYFTASYFNTNPHVSYNTASKDANIDVVSDTEYWMLDRNSDGTGLNNVRVTLYWDEARSATVPDPDDMQVAHWNGEESQWEGNSVYYVAGSDAIGTITSDYIYSFSPFTLATKSGAWALPVDLLSFYAECTGHSALITWQTASEINNDYFTVEASSDLQVWSSITKIKGAGNSNRLLSYQFEDFEPTTGLTRYYRLKQTDFDGNFSYSEVRALNCNADLSEPEVILYPNPSASQIYINGLPDQMAIFSIFDHTGQLYFQNQREADGIVTLDISSLPQGIYLLRITLPAREIVKKIIKK